MQSVKVRRTGIETNGAADVLRSELGAEYEVSVGPDGTLNVRKGLARAKVVMRAEPGGTVFDVSGEGLSFFPLVNLTAKALNNMGIARRTASVISGAEAFRDDN
jgi:hypothetical protein